MHVTITGDAGAGKSAGKVVAEALGSIFFSMGDVQRILAEKHGFKGRIEEFSVYMRTHPEIDREADDFIKAFPQSNPKFVFDARLAWHWIPGSFKVFLRCGDDERFLRIALRDGCTVEEARRKTLMREAALRDQYRELYGIENFQNPDPKVFDLILDTTSLPKHVVPQRIISAFRQPA
jgi:cytidylate kinase